ncbi:MAG TPA: hypothetical protein VFZ11_03980 [Gemmatimonadaceae bacterium]
MLSPTTEREEVPETIGVAALRGALASLVGGVVLEAVWGATARALHHGESPGTGVARRDEPAGVPCPPGASLPSPCDPRGVAAWGAVYGTLQQKVRAPTIVHGLLLGVLVHAASGAGLGVVSRAAPTNGTAAPRRTDSAAPVLAHVAYGLATAATYELLS